MNNKINNHKIIIRDKKIKSKIIICKTIFKKVYISQTIPRSNKEIYKNKKVKIILKEIWHLTKHNQTTFNNNRNTFKTEL